MKFPLFLQGKEKTIRVVGMVDKNKKGKENGVFIDGKGYIDENEYIWIYSGSGKPINSNEYPYFWLNEEGEKVFSSPEESTMNQFSSDKLVDLSMGVIVNNTKEGEELYNEQAINDMNAGAAVFVPIIQQSDDFLKKIIKTAIIDKGIDISRLKYKMDEKYILPNMKAALNNSTKMSVVYFLTWCELLGLDFTIAVEDNGTDTVDPLKKPIYYVSRKDEVLHEDEM